MCNPVPEMKGRNLSFREKLNLCESFVVGGVEFYKLCLPAVERAGLAGGGGWIWPVVCSSAVGLSFHGSLAYTGRDWQS